MNNATTDITDTTYASSTSGNRQRNTYMLIGFSFISLLMIGIFLAFVHRKCRQSTSSAKQWCLSCCSRQPENRCPSVSRTEEVAVTENTCNTVQIEPEPEHLYENLAFTDDDGKIKKEIVVKERSVNPKREMHNCSGFCDTEDDSGISDVCTSPRCSESISSIDTRYFAYDKNSRMQVYYNVSFDHDLESKGSIRVLMPESLDTDIRRQKRKKHVHVYENIDRDQHTYVNVANEQIAPNVKLQQRQHFQQKPQKFHNRDTQERGSQRKYSDIHRTPPMYIMDPNYENLKPEKRLEHTGPETVYYVNDHNNDRILEAFGDSFRLSQRNWRDSFIQREHHQSQDNAKIVTNRERSSPSKVRHVKGFYRRSSGRRNIGSNRVLSNYSPSKNNVLPDSRVEEHKPRVMTQYVKAADGTLRAITLHM